MNIIKQMAEIANNSWFQLIAAVTMLYGSISLTVRIGKEMTTSAETYRTSKGKIKVNDKTYIETNNKLYRLRAFHLNGDAIIQQIWEDEKSHIIIKGEWEKVTKNEIIKMLESSKRIVGAKNE